MEIIHRKLITESRNSTSLLCKQYCDPEINKSGGYCISICLDFCRDICLYPLSSLVDEDERKKSNKSNTFLVVASSLVVVTFFLVGMYVFYVKYYSKRTRSSDSSQTQQRQPLSEDTHDHEVFIDEDHGPELDHPIWYIRTVGLQQSIISSITMCQYKGGDGLVEGTECSVCLSEFQEDETLRLLPKCNHAFHVPCIDTWLRSHTNCPMCRAPIVTTVATPAPEPNVVVNSSPDEETQVEIFENIEASSGGMENEVCEIGIETEDNRESSGKQIDETLIEEVNGVVEPRRSVSMDSLAASKICLQLSDRNSNTQLVAVNKLNRGIVPNRNSGNQKFQRQRSSKGSSSKGRSLQSGPQNMKRSSSCNGKFLICRDIQTSDSVFPLKSF